MYDEFVEISFVWNLLSINLMASNTIYHVRCSCYGCYWELVGVCVSVFPRIPWNKLDKTKSQMIIAHAIQLIAFVLHRSSFDTTARYYQGSWSTWEYGKYILPTIHLYFTTFRKNNIIFITKSKFVIIIFYHIFEDCDVSW